MKPMIHWRGPGTGMPVSALVRTLAGGLAGMLLVGAVAAQEFDWHEMAAREAQRVREMQRAEALREQYERRRAAAHARMRSEDTATLYASTPSPVDTQLSCPVEPVAHTPGVVDRIFSERADGTLLINIGDGTPTAGGRQDAGLGPPYRPGTLAPVIPSQSPTFDFAAAHADLMNLGARDEATSPGTVGPHGIPFFPSASDAHRRQGIAQVLNRSGQAGVVRIEAVDDTGRRYGPLALFVESNGTVRIDSDDLENGNEDKGLFGGTGSGVGDWRLELSSELPIEALSYVRSWDGVVSSMHDMVPSDNAQHRVPIFNPASDWDRESRLRLINPGSVSAEVAITGIDSRGNAPGTGVSVTVPAGASFTYTAAELESGRGAGLQGSLGEGTGEWQLLVRSEQPLTVMNLLASPTGHLTNLSTAPLSGSRGAHDVPLFPAASDPSGSRGLVRVINRTGTAGSVQIKAFDDTQWDYAALVLPIGPGEAVQFDSNDLEQGNPARGLPGGTGPGQGDWRLELTSDLDIKVLSYVRAWDGLLTSMHDVAPSEEEGTRHRVSMFNPEGRLDRENRLRLINPGSELAEVAISGVDALGRSLGDGVAVTLPAGASRTYTAEELQTGEGIGLRGSLGDGSGEWRLTVESQEPLQVMSLLSAPTGHLSNLSTAPVLVPKTLPPVFATDTETPGEETAEDVFRTEVSPIVQAKCVNCHRSGGFPADVPNSRLQFNPATVEGHVELNLAVIEAFIAVLGDDEDVEDPATYILNKVQGVDHGGGLQLTAGTDNYASLERFLGLLGEAVAPVEITPETLFEGVTMESARSTLRRAAIVFAGRVPTNAEYAAIEGAGDEEEDGSEERLRATIRGLMTGPEFNEFLIRASNDRLLTDRRLSDVLMSEGDGFYVEYSNKLSRLWQESLASGDSREYQQFRNGVHYGAGRAPLELIAHVVQNDLPYSEILTANYVMANPQAAQAYGATIEFDDPQDVHEFRPARIVSYYRNDESKKTEIVDDFLTIVHPGNLATDYPHAGIMNTHAFLNRYPTTATNRNRARSRWTYYHFLGLDIEKSASRTADPIALADTNNPTMNNPACTVCHTVMDPVAGAFQNYGDDGYYRDEWGGLDSLDEHYKGGADHLQRIYVDGDAYHSRQIVSQTVWLEPGSSLTIKHPHNNGCGVEGNETCGRDLRIEDFHVRDLQGQIVDHIEWSELDEHCEYDGASNDGSGGNDDHYQWWGSGCDRVPVQVSESGNYVVRITVWADQSGDEITWFQLGAVLYQDGDTWYRDMRDPGFDGQLAPNTENSLLWLAQRIVEDERFAEAAVKFWWPGIMGAEVAEPPADENDAGFEGLLLASNAQAAEVARLADGFRSGFQGEARYDLKDLLVEIVLSRWFRAESVSNEDAVRATALASVGAKRVLTPEELARKTLALTGFQWGRSREPAGRPWTEGQNKLTDSENGYRLLYGGIDSDGITERAGDFTSMMAGVAQSQALQSSYPIVMRELYLLPDEGRRLFGGVDKLVTPTFEFGDTFEIAAASRSEIETLRLEGQLTAGTIVISLAFLNDFEDDGGDRDVLLDRLTVRRGAEVIHRYELEDHENIDCNHYEQGAFHLSGSGSHCVLNVMVEVPADGIHQLEILAWADQYGEELARLQVAVESDSGNSVGSNQIRAQLVELYDKLHGISVTTDSPEVQDAYELFVEVWERKQGVHGGNFRRNAEDIHIDWPSDQRFLDGIADDLWRDELNEDGWTFGWDWDRISEFFDTIDWSDPHAVARTWTVVLAYLMMDYRYLYL